MTALLWLGVVGGTGWRVRLMWQAPGVEVDGLTDGVCALGDKGLSVGKSYSCDLRTWTVIGGRTCASIDLVEGGARVWHAGHVYPIQVDQTMLRDGSHPVGEGQVVRFFMPGPGKDGLVPAFDLCLERGAAPSAVQWRPGTRRKPPTDTQAPERSEQDQLAGELRADLSALFVEWRNGDALAAGSALMGPLAPAERAHRAAAVLEVCRQRWEPVPQVEHVLTLAMKPTRWSEAHAAFTEVRKLTLAEERAPTSRLYLCLLFVAENAAKTIYNGSGEPAPFDADSPWWLASSARQMARAVDEPDFDRAVWSALSTDSSGADTAKAGRVDRDEKGSRES